MSHLKIFAFLVVMQTFFPQEAGAFDFSGRNEAPIRIQSDSAELDDQKGVSIYIGKVIIKQGLDEVNADKVVIHTDDDGIKKMEASGKLAHFRQQEAASEPETNAYAEKIIYRRSENQVQLINNARLEQSGNIIQGNIIKYQAVGRRATVESGADSSGVKERVEMIINPKKKTE